MQTKRALYEQHVQKHGKNAVSESAFRKRISSGRMIIAAIDTPKLYANEYQVEKEEKKAESKIQGGEPEGGDGQSIVIVLHHFEEIWDEIYKIRKYIKRTGIFGAILFSICTLYRIVRLFAYLFWGM